MPVFQEEAGANRDSRIYPCRALPLPRLAPKPVENDESLERYEVVIIGVSNSYISYANVSLME